LAFAFVQLEISEALMYEDEIPMEEPPADEPPVTDEVVLIDQSLKEKPPVIDQENVEETDLPQNVEQSEMTDEPEQDYKGEHLRCTWSFFLLCTRVLS
jgi:hypothetical protein